MSPQSQAKHRRKHYLVKDKEMHCRCLNCGDVGGIHALKSLPCHALDRELLKGDGTTKQATSLRLPRHEMMSYREEMMPQVRPLV